MVFQKGCRILPIKLFQILQKLGKQNGYHLLNMANAERNLKTTSTKVLAFTAAFKNSYILPLQPTVV